MVDGRDPFFNSIFDSVNESVNRTEEPKEKVNEDYSEPFEIMFDDLTEEAQERLLDFVGAGSPDELNWETVSIAQVPYPEDTGDYDDGDMNVEEDFEEMDVEEGKVPDDKDPENTKIDKLTEKDEKEFAIEYAKKKHREKYGRELTPELEMKTLKSKLQQAQKIRDEAREFFKNLPSNQWRYLLQKDPNFGKKVNSYWTEMSITRMLKALKLLEEEEIESGINKVFSPKIPTNK